MKNNIEIFLLAILLFTSQLAASQEYTLDDWMTISDISEFEWSSDGRYIYYISNAAPSGTYDIFRVSADGRDATLLGDEQPGVRAERKEQLTISTDGEFIYFTASSYFSAFHNIYRIPASGGRAVALTFNDAMIETSPAISPDGQTLAYFARTESGAKLFTLDLSDVKAWPELVFPGEGQEYFPAWSVNGDLAYIKRGDIWIKPDNEDESRQVVNDSYGGGNSGHNWSPDGNRIAFLNELSGFSQVGVVDVRSGRVTSITHDPVEHGQVTWSPDGRWLAFIKSDESGMSNQLVVARSDGSGEQRQLSSGKGRRFSPRFSPDGRYVAFIENTSVRARDVWKVELSNGRLIQITDSMGNIDPDSLTEAREIFYPARDNLPIPGMMWLPPGFDPDKKYPVLIRLHGHPGQWNHDFRMMTQYFVNQGFVAIAPNPRGSVGFGQGFHDLHIADWGGEEYYDVMEIIPYMESLGFIDMDRKATWGGSGGGFMSMTVATKSPKAFEAQVIRAPVTDWKILINDRNDASGRAWTATRTPSRSRAEMGGSYDEVPEEFESRSPLNFVEKVQIPQLLFHGLRDTNVLPRQSIMWVDRMRALGKEELIEFITYPDEDHSLRRYKNTIRDRLERMTEFFSENLRLDGLE